MRQLVGILGTPIDKLNINNVMERLEQFVEEGRFHQVATANTDFLINAITDPELRHILRQCDLVVPDGMPVVWASRIMGCPLPERVAGADIVPRLAALSAKNGYRIYMLGARAEVAQRARGRLIEDYPGVQIVGCLSPSNGSVIDLDSVAILEDIRRTAPDILLVAFGNPKQEKWIHMHREQLQSVPLCIGVGGTFDFIAGEVPRAPSMLQRNGLEWTHRLCHNPRRLWRRYARDFWHGGRYLRKQWWALRSQSRSGKFDQHVALTGECGVLSVIGDMDRMVLPRFRAAADEILNSGARLILDLQGVTSLDPEVIGALLNLQKRAQYCLQEVRLVGVTPDIARLLRDCQVDRGLYPTYATVANALGNWEQEGLFWRVQCSHDAAVLSIGGNASYETSRKLETVCNALIEDGKRIDLDCGRIEYVDSHFLATLNRINSRISVSTAVRKDRMRLVINEEIRSALVKESMLDRFVVLAAPEIPQDAKHVSTYELDVKSVQRTAISLHGQSVERKPVLSVVSTS